MRERLAQGPMLHDVFGQFEELFFLFMDWMQVLSVLLLLQISSHPRVLLDLILNLAHGFPILFL